MMAQLCRTCLLQQWHRLPLKSKTPPKVLKNSTFVRSNGEYMLSEPRTGQAFNPGVIVEVSEITEWIQGNIDVGLFTHLEA